MMMHTDFGPPRHRKMGILFRLDTTQTDPSPRGFTDIVAADEMPRAAIRKALIGTGGAVFMGLAGLVILALVLWH